MDLNILIMAKQQDITVPAYLQEHYNEIVKITDP